MLSLPIAFSSVIGVFVPVGSDQYRAIEQLLQSAGAVEVRHEAA